MSNQRHIIGKVLLEIETNHLADVLSLQEEISVVFQKQALPSMEKIFEQFVDPEIVVRLDQMVIDVGKVSPELLAEEFIRKLLEALKEVLSERFTAHLPIGIDREMISQDRVKADWEVLLYFLQYGRLPWWVSLSNWQAWLNRWEKVMQEGTLWRSGSGCVARSPIHNLLASQKASQRRLISQFPEDFRYHLVLQLQPAWISCQELMNQARQLLQGLDLASDRIQFLEQQAWLLLLREMGPIPSEAKPFPTVTWMQNWLIQLLESKQLAISKSYKISPTTNESKSNVSDEPGRINHNLPLSQSSPPPKLRQTWQQLLTLVKTFSTAQRPFWLKALMQLIPLEVVDIELQQEVSKTETNEVDLREEDEASLALELPEESDSAIGANSLWEENSVPRITKYRQNSLLSPQEETAGLFVTQAGLVLLHPFLRIYFDEVGLLEGKSFRDESSQQTAIYLLYYLATKQTDALEYELVLPKLLCSWPLNEPVARGLNFPKAALAEGEHLLQIAIDYWQALKSTSPDGLRDGFLQRDGKLTPTDSGWKLRVEQKAIDILLSRLPWGVSMVTLPWMDELLTVEWT